MVFENDSFMKMRIILSFNAFFGIILLFLVLLMVYDLLTKITTGGLQSLQLAGGLLLAIIGYCFTITNKMSKLEGSFCQFEKRFDSFETRFIAIEQKLEDEKQAH